MSAGSAGSAVAAGETVAVATTMSDANIAAKTQTRRGMTTALPPTECRVKSSRRALLENRLGPLPHWLHELDRQGVVRLAVIPAHRDPMGGRRGI